MFKFFRFLSFVILFGLAASGRASQVDFSPEGTLSFAHHVLKHYPEAEWLMGEGVQVTLQGDTKTPASSWSLKMRKKHYIEFERTIGSMLCLHAFYQGNDTAYNWFVKNQKGDPLSRESFKEASSLVRKVADQYSLAILETNLLFGDLGKTPKARELAKAHGITEGDHDIFLAQCLAKCPEIFPTYTKLSLGDQRIIRENAGLLHFGHLLHVEGTAKAMLSKLKKSEILNKPDGFDFELVCHLCDISAVLAHVNNEGSSNMNQAAYETIQEGMKAVRSLAGKTENEALQVYLDLRALRVGFQDIADVDTRNVLSRLAAMMRLTTPEEGALLQKAWEEIGNKAAVIQTLNPLRLNQKIPTPTYVPAVLTNLRDSLSKQRVAPQEAMNTIIATGLPWVTSVIKSYETHAGAEYPLELTLNFNSVGGAARDNPHVLDTNPQFSINKETGEVKILS